MSEANEETIKEYLKELSEMRKRSNNPREKLALTAAISALSLSLPKEPVYNKVICGRCGSLLWYPQKVCTDCGQVVKWQ